ncbi:MAG TPA: ABC transporter permease [Alphaproteobacteria bacterium]|jgi:peptide/nickel transport system permease protein|nr:ABC transporter permease [Alphaproteobacteria bacterium]MDP6268895.1 ABC transporter permease [Alphaproteobacteria bacterium]MDP7164072.1 ABC transporter permease [Alphaproteobacteria bacterium]MDP7427503.1 ABC transporter permease [Alphaproteobacteria bacterium]HJM49164.1 ABC transporter permease [Alphaproteobacteria bacterium]
MYQYIVKRILLMIPTLLGAAVLVFFLLRLIPGDICELRMAGTGGYFDKEALDICRAEIGIDQPLFMQFIDFIWGFIQFDLGTSMWTNRPIGEEIALRFELSLQVAIMATLTATLIAIPLGTVSAIKQNTWIDYAVRIFSIAGIAMPSFWLGILIILGLLVSTQAFWGTPWMPPIQYVPLWVDPWQNLSMLIWPTVATGYRYSAVATRMTRSALLEVLREDYVRTARAKGLREKLIINRHALRNALLPVVTVIGIEFAFLMGGLVVTEQVFNLNGLGKLFVEAVTNHDYTLTQALVMVVVTVFVVTNFVVDILYAWLDPRIRYT